MAGAGRYFWYMELSRRLHSRYCLVDYIWVQSQVCEHASDSNNYIYSSFIGLRWSNNNRKCIKSYSEHVLASHNLLFNSGSHYLLHNTRIMWTQIKISVKTTFSRLLCLTVARLSKVPPSTFSVGCLYYVDFIWVNELKPERSYEHRLGVGNLVNTEQLR